MLGTPDENLANEVDDGSDEEQNQSDGNQGRELQPVGFTKLVGDDTRHGVSGGGEAGGNLVRVADEHRHGHGLAQGTSDGKDVGGKDSRTGSGEHHAADDLGTGRTHGVGSFLQVRGHHLDELGTQRGGVGHNHDGEDEGGGQDAGALRRDVQLHEEGAQGVETPESVDDGGDTGKQVGHRAQDGGNLLPAEVFAHEEGDGQREGDAEDECQQRGQQRTRDEGQCTVALVAGRVVPVVGADELPEAELAERACGIIGEGIDDSPTDDRDDHCRQNKDKPEYLVLHSCVCVGLVSLVKVESVLISQGAVRRK